MIQVESLSARRGHSDAPLASAMATSRSGTRRTVRRAADRLQKTPIEREPHCPRVRDQAYKYSCKFSKP